MTPRSAAATAAVPARPGIEPRISDREFERLRDLIYGESGIYLQPTKKELLKRRLHRRIVELGLDSFGAYYRRVSTPEAEAERMIMLDCIATNETRFFRERKQFELLAREILPSWRSAAEDGRRSRRVRAWSTACSTGQEAYSLAMVLHHALPPSAGWQLEVLATDLSTKALEVAASAVWPMDEAKNIPEDLLHRYMLRGKASQKGWIKAAPELRGIVDCRRLNLHREPYPAIGSFDLIFCRNVLIYFDNESRLGVLGRLLRHLGPGGYLFGGHAESLTSITSQLQAVVPTVYRQRRDRAAGGQR